MYYNNVLLSHTDCDGLGSIILAQHFDLSFDKIVSYDYGFEDEAATVQILYDSDNIVVADLALTPALHDDLLQKGKTVQVFDHHETSQWTAERQGCVWDNKRSGTKIFFDEYVKPRIGRYRPVVREFVDLVDVYDRWDLASPLRPMSEDLQRVFVKYGNWDLDDALVRHDRYIMAMLRKLQKDEHFGWNNVELMYIRDAKASEDKAYNDALAMLQIRMDNKGRRFGVFSAWGKISMTCHRMLNVDNMDVDYLVVAQTFHGKWGTMSLRSREGKFDLMELAGVAGHKASAGATLTPENAQKFMRERLCFRYKSDIKNEDEPVIESIIDIF
jgi:oligoribonuclease NrnB/cAMP/cGMP phosphodiesterase (DHH superfamily)